MFKIIGADQKEYGPVSTAQIRQWITDGRLNANSQAQRAAGGDWQPLSAFEEFADIFNPAGAAPSETAAPATPYSPAAAPMPTASREMALSAVKGPAIALAVSGALGVICYLFRAIFLFVTAGSHHIVIPANATPFARGFIQGMQGPLGGMFALYFAAINGFVLFGALKMMKLQGHTLAIFTCIVAMIPCATTGLCCVLGLPFGIWGIIVLNKPDVKSQFTN